MEENMEFRPLQINVISAKDLKDVNFLTKMDVYAVVLINGDRCTTTQKTPVDKGCGSNPEWNYSIKFTIDEAAVHQNRLNLVFLLKSYRWLGHKHIGAVQVPIKELLDHINGNEKVEQNVSYSVRLPNGKEKGILNFSYKFGEKFNKPVPQPPVPAGAELAMYVQDKHGEKPVMAYPPPTEHGEKPVMAYPPPPIGYLPGPSTGYPSPPGAYPPPPHGMAGYPYPPPGESYPPPAGSYPPYGYQQAPAPGFGYPGYPPHGGYGYPPMQTPEKPKKSGMGGAGAGAAMGLGLAGGVLGGILIAEIV